MKREEDRLDLSALDPENDPLRLERVVAGVLDRLGPGLVPDPVPLPRRVALHLAGRFRPIFGASVLTAAAAGAVLIIGQGDSTGPVDSGLATGLVEVPTEWQAWLAAAESPATEELLFGLAGEAR